MKVTIKDTSEFKKALNLAAKAVAAKTTIPALECVKIVATDDNKIIITGYDLVTGITVVVDSGVYIHQVGEVLVNAKTFVGLTKKFSTKSEITLETDGSKILKVYKPEMEFNLPTQAVETFPTLPELTNAETFSIPFLDIKRSIEQTLFATAEENEANIQKGCCFTLDIANGKMKAFALDGFRVATRITDIENGNTSFKAKLPKTILTELAKNGAADNETVNISFDKRNIVFDIGNCRMHGRIYGGNIFDVDMLKIPEKLVVKANTAELLDAVDSLTPLVTAGDTNGRTLIAKFNGGKVEFSLTSTLGTAKTNVDVEVMKDEVQSEIVMGFNINYFLDAVNNVESEETVIYINSSVSAIRIVDGTSSNFIVLPIKIK